ncbi:MAG: penicillin-binding protein 2 [Actinomycetota bacterium]
MNYSEDRTRLRLAVIGLVILSMFAVLLARLWFLQVLAGPTFAAQATRNHVRLVRQAPPRGRILDRNGVVLVGNRTALSVGVRREDFPKDVGEAAVIKKRLSKLLGISVAAIEVRMKDRRKSPYEPVVIAEDVDPTTIFTIRERQEDYQGVETMELPVREYPKGSIAAHVLGYVGEVNDRELGNPKFATTYRLGDEIGRTGVERSYEEWLRGTPGLLKLEVDARGQVLRSLGRRDPVPGGDLQLSVDLEVQRVAEEALVQGIARARGQVFREDGKHFKAPAGAAVVLDAKSGEVIAMASNPTYDLRRFVGGVASSYFATLSDPEGDLPLYNRAAQASYPPGSTFKPIIATAALSSGAATPGGMYPCLTQYRFGDRVFRNWRARNTTISLAQALIESCDTVFYNFAADWWRVEYAAEKAGRRPKEIMQAWARKFGLGTPTGIDLPSEGSGRVPDRAYRKRAWEANREDYCKKYRATKLPLWEDLCVRGFLWRPGDSINMSIGQGDVEATPLQMAVVYAALANGGNVVTPHLGLKVVRDDGTVVKKVKPVTRLVVKAPAQVRRYVESALRNVVEGGTASFPYRGWPVAEIPMAAKTGSAEIAGKQPFSWFASYGPVGDPRYVVVAVVEQAGFGSQVAGPVVRRIMDELFDQTPLPIVFGERSD